MGSVRWGICKGFSLDLSARSLEDDAARSSKFKLPSFHDGNIK